MSERVNHHANAIPRGRVFHRLAQEGTCRNGLVHDAIDIIHMPLQHDRRGPQRMGRTWPAQPRLVGVALRICPHYGHNTVPNPDISGPVLI